MTAKQRIESAAERVIAPDATMYGIQRVKQLASAREAVTIAIERMSGDEYRTGDIELTILYQLLSELGG